jgi:hypothetical protein
MLKFTEVKTELKKRYSNTKYFNKAFLDAFIKCYKISDYTAIFNTKFYSLNGPAYCNFLELFNSKYKAVLK